MKSSLKIWGLAAVLAVQFAALGWIIARYERVVTGGVECRFACQAYDPHAQRLGDCGGQFHVSGVSGGGDAQQHVTWTP